MLRGRDYLLERKRLGVNQADAAKASGIPVPVLIAFEREDVVLDGEMAERLLTETRKLAKAPAP